MADVVLFHLRELVVVVLLAVHLEDDVDVLWRDQEPLAVVLGNTGLNVVVDDDLLIVGLVVLSVTLALEDGFSLELVAELVDVDLGRILVEGRPDDLIVSCVQQVHGVTVTKLHESQMAKDRGIYDSQVVVDCLVEDHVVDKLVHLLTGLSKLVDSVDINELEELFNLLVWWDSFYEESDEVEQLVVLEVDAEEQ